MRVFPLLVAFRFTYGLLTMIASKIFTQRASSTIWNCPIELVTSSPAGKEVKDCAFVTVENVKHISPMRPEIFALWFLWWIISRHKPETVVFVFILVRSVLKPLLFVLYTTRKLGFGSIRFSNGDAIPRKGSWPTGKPDFWWWFQIIAMDCSVTGTQKFRDVPQQE